MSVERARPTEAPAHPAAAVAAIEAALDAIDAGAYDHLDAAVLVNLSARLATVASRIGAHRGFAARVIDERRIARLRGATNTADLLGRSAGHDRSAGHQVMRTAKAAPAASARGAALAAGQLTERQARIIDAGLDRLPPSSSSADRDRTERHLIDAAARLTPRELQAAADRAAGALVSDEAADAAENAAVADRERAARAKAEFSMWDNTDGTWSGRFTLPDLEAAHLKAAVDGFAAPRRVHRLTDAADSPQAEGPGPASAPLLTSAHRQGLGFADLACRLTDLPVHGGVSSTVVVTLDIDALTGDLERVGHLSDGQRISAGQARRLACSAGLVPAVLGGASRVLDVGTAQRLFTPAQRTALVLRDRGCTMPGCDRPAAWTEAHHLVPFSRGGPTDLANAALVCFFHHHWLHEHHIEGRLGPDSGVPEFNLGGRWRRHERFAGPPRPREPGPSGSLGPLHSTE